MNNKLWGGRFEGGVVPAMAAFSDSINFDRRLWRVDIQGSQAYAAALGGAGLLTAEEVSELQSGLDRVAAEWEADTFELQSSDEDIHTANERRLGELVGAVAGKLHTGRSRNDQVATDLRLWLREQIDSLRGDLRQLVGVMADRAEEYVDVAMPGFTHLQTAQPIRFSHWLLSHAWPLVRDLERLGQVRARVNVLPLGSGALAGNPFAIDREVLAAALGFEAVSANSVDAVSDRDFAAEFLFAASLSMVHLSQLAEDIVIHSSQPFGFLQLADAYSTGSSLMPQKKNPDSFELIRGKSGRVAGSLTGLLMTLKGLPRAYNRDLQEDKEPLFDAVATWHGALEIAAGAIATMECRSDRTTAVMDDFMLATDVAEHLVRQGIPFRQAHHVAGAAVRLAETRGLALAELAAADWALLHPALAGGIAGLLDFEASLESRDVEGGTSERAQRTQLERLRQSLERL